MGIQYDMHTVPETVFIIMLLYQPSTTEWDCRRMGAKESDATTTNEKEQ